MKLAWCVTTYNRLNYLQALLTSYFATRDNRHDWRVYVVDDGSTDGTVDWLRQNENVHLMQQARLGVHEAKNRLFEAALADGCNFGWQVDDDILCVDAAWDRAYIDAADASGYEHLILYDRVWARRHRRDGAAKLCTAGPLQSAVPTPHAVQGACWTFSPSVVDRVGWLDVVTFGPCGYGHTDYTLRACRAGCNRLVTDSGPWDCLHSERYVRLQRADYRPSIAASDRLRAAFGRTPLGAKLAALNDTSRVFIPRQQPRWDMEGHELG